MRYNPGIVLFFALLAVSFTSSGQRLSEICPGNRSGFKHAFLGYVDWLELYNENESTVNLNGYFLTDDLNEPEKWVFPSMVILGHDHLLVTAENSNDHENSINFPLSLSGGRIYFLSPDGNVLDSMHYPALEKNHSYGRIDEKTCYFETPTPKDSNALSVGYKGYASSVTVNRESGLHASGTHIVLRSESPEEQIVYALNGQRLAEGEVYNTPLILGENITLKAVARGDSLIDSPVLYRTYFVEKMHELPVVNLVLDSLTFFDETNGIYLPGPDANDDEPYMGANFWRGTEVNGHFSYFDAAGVLRESLECDLKLHGGLGSRVHPMKSIQIRAKNGYNPSEIEHDFFETKNLSRYKRLILRNAGNDFCNLCMKDAVLHNYYLDSELDIDLMAGQPVVLYINGSYWGIHNLREKPDRHYIATNYGLNADSVNLLENAALDIVDGRREDFEAVEKYAVENNLGDPVHFNWVAHRVDLGSMADYFIVELYVNNRDWPNFNIKVWNAGGHKWRYLCYDMDVGFRYNNSSLDEAQSLTSMLTRFSESNPHVAILSQALENEEFKRYFINRYADLLNTIFQPDAIYNAFVENKNRVAFDMTDHYEKWCGPISKWENNFEGVKGFIDGRLPVVREDIATAFDKPQAVEIKVDNYPATSGNVQLNTLVLDEFPFTGKYFTTNPITLTAKPNPGEIFERWENLQTGKVWHEPTILVNPKEGDHLVAIYSSAEDLYHLSVAPNPVTDYLNLRFSLPESGTVFVEIINLSGQLVNNHTYEKELLKGTHHLRMNVEGMNPGLYFLYLTTDKGRETIRIYKR